MSNNLDELAKTFRTLSPDQKLALLESADPELQKAMATQWRFLARPAQYPSVEFGRTKHVWMCLTGRGWGKTRTATEWVVERVVTSPTPIRIACVNKNESDVRKISIEGESGILAALRRYGYSESFGNVGALKKTEYKYTRTAGLMSIEFASGSVLQFFSAENPDKFAGWQFHHVWLDELALYEKLDEVWSQLGFCVRLGEHNMFMITTTPRPKPLMRVLYEDSDTLVTTGALLDNAANLSKSYKEKIIKQHDGTRMGRQEIYGEFLWDNPDSLFPVETLDSTRLERLQSPQAIMEAYNINRVIVAIDPAVTSGQDADHTGILVVGKCEDGRGYVLDDVTMRGRPKEWAQKAYNAFIKWDADMFIAEVNQGGEMVEEVLKQVAPNAPYKAVRASKGKRTRAEPIASLYEQGKISHVGKFDKLEDEMLLFTPDKKLVKSPDRVDALVWGLTHLMLAPSWDGTITWV